MVPLQLEPLLGTPGSTAPTARGIGCDYNGMWLVRIHDEGCAIPVCSKSLPPKHIGLELFIQLNMVKGLFDHA